MLYFLRRIFIIMSTLKNGDYNIPVSLKGGSGRAGIASPAPVHVDGKDVTAEITWSSEHYDYMKVDGKKYLKTNKSGNSTFEIPVKDISKPLDVIGDTTAMSKPYEIEYTITFDTAHAVRVGGSASPASVAIPVIIACAAAAVITCIAVKKHKKKASSND